MWWWCYEENGRQPSRTLLPVVNGHELLPSTSKGRTVVSLTLLLRSGTDPLVLQLLSPGSYYWSKRVSKANRSIGS